MKKRLILLIFLLVGAFYNVKSQELVLKKGVVQDSVRLNDSIPESFAVYLPSDYDPGKKWPILFAMDMKGRGKQVVHMFSEVAEEQGYIVAGSNNLRDSLSIAQNMLVVSRMFNTVFSILSIHKERTYTAGFSDGAKFASLIPSFIRPVEGVISCGAAITFMELIDPKKPFQFIGIVGRSDFNFTEMSESQTMNFTTQKYLNKLNFSNYLMVFNGVHEWPQSNYLQRALEIFTLKAMSKGNVERDSAYISKIYNRNFSEINKFIARNDLLGGVRLIEEMLGKFKGHKDLNQLKKRRKVLLKEKEYINQKRKERKYFQKEYFIKKDYEYNLNDDILTLNYNNLGWWNYQMGEIKKHIASPEPLEKEMGMRLLGFLNALIEDNIDLELAQSQVNDEALSFLWMVKTITAPKEFSNYLKIISDSAKYEDFGTALFYLEELLKNGYENKSELYSLEHTALLRITQEFNEIIDKYLKDARYDLIEE